MWIEQTETCPECGSEVTLYTDGRVAYAQTTFAPYGKAFADADEVWREDFVFVLSCPTIDTANDDRCAARIVFTGEGRQTADRSDYATEIAS